MHSRATVKRLYVKQEKQSTVVGIVCDMKNFVQINEVKDFAFNI